jgi:hypothetical protein
LLLGNSKHGGFCSHAQIGATNTHHKQADVGPLKYAKGISRR